MRSGVDAVMMVRIDPSSISMGRLQRTRRRLGRGPAHQADAVEDEGIAGEDEEEQHALEDAGDLLGHAEGDLHPLPAEIGQSQQEPGKEDADRIEAAEKGDDDRGEA